jgi:hypothetical protein
MMWGHPIGPCLRKADMVALDNLDTHKASRVERVAEALGVWVLS